MSKTCFLELVDTGKFPENVMRKMVLVLSHLFAREYLHANYKRRIHLCPTSKVILEDLPNDFAKALQSYNDQVANVFNQYLTTVAAEHEKQRGEENKLPLSEIGFPDQKSVNVIEEYGTIKNLGRFSIKYYACSSFTALSGNSDLRLHSQNKTEEEEEEEEEEESEEDEEEEEGSSEDENNSSTGYSESSESGEESEENLESEEDEVEFYGGPIDHLLKVIRQDVYTDMNVVPTLPLKKRYSTGRFQRLNAYALDFFKHGSAKVIEKENRIREGEVFNALKDFYLTIRSISCSLEELGPADDNVVLAFKQLAQEYGKKFNKQYSCDI